MAGIKRTYLREVNPHLICPLCRGYLIDATTVVECLHSFCRSCILKHLRKDAQCPSCKQLLNTAKPNIKADKALQDIVYKLVPGLYHKEMRKRRDFYSKHPEHGFAASLNHLGGAESATPEQRGEDVSGRLIFAPEDAISLSLEYLPVGADPLSLLSKINISSAGGGDLESNQKQKANGGIANRRYLQCPALVTIAHLKKFLGLKYSVDMTRYNIDICHTRAPLPEHWTLMDVAHIFAWKRNAPIRFFYRITQEEQRLEAPPNDRPSTPGLGASQPITNEQVNEPVEKEPEPVPEDEKPQKKPVTEPESPVPQPELKPKSSPPSPSHKSIEAKQTDPEKGQELLAKRSVPSSKENASKSSVKTGSNGAESTQTHLASPKTEEASKQVKSPIKILKNPDGNYQVMRGPSVATRNNNNSATDTTTTTTAAVTNATTKSSPPPPPLTPATPAEFSVVSIADGANSNSVKITLKQCPPGSANGSSNSSSSKKPKVISNVLLRNSSVLVEKASAVSSGIAEQLQDGQKQEKQKRKVTFVDMDSSSLAKPQPKKPAVEQTEKKQFLQSFRLTAKQAAAAAAAQTNNQQNQEVSNSDQSTTATGEKEVSSVETQAKNVLKNVGSGSTNQKDSNSPKSGNTAETTTAKKRQTEVKMSSTNIADRLSDAKKLASGDNSSSQTISSSSNDQQPIDVYAFPNDPPSALPAGAVKRKCPPGVPIFEIRKKHQQYQAGKRAGVNTARGGAVKCYRNQTKPMVYAKPPPSPARPLQNLPSPVGNAANVNVSNNTLASAANPAVSSTSPKTASSSSPPMLISTDTRNLLDGCGLNIPASLSITLTAPKSPARSVGGGGDPQIELHGTKDGNHHHQQHNNVDKMNPSITLNDKSVDPKVLKALKTGQMRMPAANAKTKGRQSITPERQQGPAAKRKKEEMPAPPPPPPPRNILDLSGTKKMDLHPLRIPTPLGKYKVKPPNWSQANSPKPSGKDELPNYTANGQVVTLTGGQRFYRAPPGSLTPAAHRIGDIPTPTRAPVYAPCFSSPTSSSRPATNLSSVFPSLQSLYALSQAPSLEQFHMDARMRMNAVAAAAVAAAAKDSNSSNSASNGNSQIGKSHIAAQCAPVKPARTTAGSFAVPIAKQSIAGASAKLANSNAGNKSSAASTPGDSETSTSSSDSPATEQKSRKAETSKESPSKTDFEQNENCASSTEEGNSQQGAASPRVTSTASPSPPPSVSEAASNTSEKSSLTSKSEKRQSSSGSEVTSSNKSPESPDSSSVVTENIGNLVDSTKPALEKSRDVSPMKSAENKSVNDDQANGAKSNGTIDTEEFKKPVTSETLKNRFLAAFPSNEWATNPIAAEQFGHFLKSLSSMQAEAQSKNAKAIE